MKATRNGQVIASSDQTIVVDGYHYFPRDAVQMELLEPAPKTEDDHACPHGVQFYDVAGSKRAAWSYEAPRASMKNVDHWIGFWGDVEIVK